MQPTKLIAAIETHQRLFIYRHTAPDPDAIGSQYGLALILKKAWPNKVIIPVGAVTTPLNWLGDPETWPQSVAPTASDLAIVVDCANQSRIAGELPAGMTVYKIDHHPNREPFGTWNWVDESYSSCAEMIYALTTLVPAKLKMTPAAAMALYAGLIGDTVRFSTPGTTTRTLKIAAALASHGVDIAAVSYQEMAMTPAVGRLTSYVLQQLQVSPTGLAHIVLSQAKLHQLGVSEVETDAIEALPGSLTTVQVWVIFIERATGDYRVHFRSKRRPIDSVARAFNGGGHPLASGAFVPDLATVQQVIARLETED